MLFENVWNNLFDDRLFFFPKITINERQRASLCHLMSIDVNPYFMEISEISHVDFNASTCLKQTNDENPRTALISNPSVSSIPWGGSSFALVLGNNVPKMESKSYQVVINSQVLWKQHDFTVFFSGTSTMVNIPKWFQFLKLFLCLLVDLLPRPSQGLRLFLIQVLAELEKQRCFSHVSAAKVPDPSTYLSLMTFSILPLSFKMMSLLDKSSWLIRVVHFGSGGLMKSWRWLCSNLGLLVLLFGSFKHRHGLTALKKNHPAMEDDLVFPARCWCDSFVFFRLIK